MFLFCHIQYFQRDVCWFPLLCSVFLLSAEPSPIFTILEAADLRQTRSQTPPAWSLLEHLHQSTDTSTEISHKASPASPPRPLRHRPPPPPPPRQVLASPAPAGHFRLCVQLRVRSCVAPPPQSPGGGGALKSRACALLPAARGPSAAEVALRFQKCSSLPAKHGVWAAMACRVACSYPPTRAPRMSSLRASEPGQPPSLQALRGRPRRWHLRWNLTRKPSEES